MDYTHHSKHRSIEPHGKINPMDLEHRIHCLETEAYSSTLKAFIAQSDLLTWGKVGLLAELRKELNVTDVEHGEIRMTINSDESVKWIREQRKLKSHAQGYVKINTPGCASTSMDNSKIRLKPLSSAAIYPPKSMSHGQASLTSIPVPSMAPKFNYDRQMDELAMFSHGNADKSVEMFKYNVQLPPMLPTGRGRVVKEKHQLKKGFCTSDCVNSKDRSDLIEIRATDRVIHDVERMLFGREKPDLVAIEKAKLTLREQERALLEALAKLTSAIESSSSDVPSNQMQNYQIPKDAPGGQEIMMHGHFYGQMGMLNGPGDSFRSMPTG